MTINIVMGTTASGKTHFIKERFSECEHFSIGEYQKKIKNLVPDVNKLSDAEYRAMLVKANEMIMEDVVNALREGKAVVMEHTLFRAKRRIVYIEAFRTVSDEPVHIYVMKPTDEQLMENLKVTNDESYFKNLKWEMSNIEMPNVAEGYEKIYVVTDGCVEEINEPANEEMVAQAKRELEEEERVECENKKHMEEYEKLLKDMEENGFWHYCEVCGKKEFLKPAEAYEQGWDYPPKIGVFGVVSPRTCGECGIDKTLYWRMMSKSKEEKNSIENFSKEEQRILARILSEPFSLIEEENSDESK